MDWKPNALKADGPSRGLNQEAHWCKASKELLRQPAPPEQLLSYREFFYNEHVLRDYTITYTSNIYSFDTIYSAVTGWELAIFYWP